MLQIKVPVRVDFAGGWTDVDNFCNYYTGAVVNCAINKYVVGKIVREPYLQVKYFCPIPDGSGLGTSAAMNVCLMKLIRPDLPNEAIADLAYRFEKSLGIITGKQDHLASVLGGWHYFEFEKDFVKIEKLDINKEFAQKIKSNMLLFYTGKSRLSSDIHKKVWATNKFKYLHKMVQCAKNVRQAILDCDLDMFYHWINENWKMQKLLHESVCPEDIDNLYNEIGDMVRVFRLTGAGGGGCLQIFVKKGNKLKVKDILINKYNFKEIKYDFSDGLVIETIY